MQGSTRIDELRQKFHENPRRYFAPLANEYRKAGDPEQAIAICRAHLAQQPGHMSGHVVYGQALYDAKRVEEARVVFEKALSLDPDNSIVLRQLGDIARQKGETSEAKHWYSRALDADPQNTEIAAYIAELTEPGMEKAEAGAVAPQAEVPVAQAEEPAPVAETAPAEEFAALPVDIEIELPEPAREPEVVTTTPEDQELPALDEDEVAWRKTPHHEESPFVTRTMAELYESQGYREAALDVYRQLALHHPENREILDRIEALEKPEIQPESEPPQLIDVPEPVSELQAEAPAEPRPREEEPRADEEYQRLEEPDSFAGLTPSETPYAQPTSGALTGFDAPLISDVPSEPEPTVPAEPQARTDGFFTTDSEEVEETEPDSSGGRRPHFTEMELDGDTWDTDAWGAGFAEGDETVTVDFEAPDVPPAAPVSDVVSAREPEPVVEPVAEAEPAAEPEPEYEPEPEPVVEPPVVAGVAELVPEVEEEHAPEGAEQELVAYSPHIPEPEDLPHFAPKQPTVREFFATLATREPPSSEPERSYTARAVVPEIPDEPEYPLAGDAFANMFADSPVSDEDSRAAFALSGALGAPVSPPPVVAQPAPPPTPAPLPETSQESEEDIRRFREWLDGLAES